MIGLPIRLRSGAKLALALFIALSASSLVQAYAATPREVGPAHYTYAFKDADLADVAEAILGRALNLTYSVDADLSGKVTFRIDRNMTPAELLAAFESTLALQDIAVVKNGDTLVLEKRAKAKASTTLRPLEGGQHAIGYQTLAVPLVHAAPQEVAKALQAMGSGGVVSYVDEERNQIVLTGTAQEVDGAVQTIHMLDHDTASSARMRWFPLEHAPAVDVAQELNDLLRGAHIDGASVTPMKRLKGLYVFARTEAGLDEIARLVAKLDVEVGGADQSNTLWVYHPHNASAEGLKAALSGVMGEAGQGQGGDDRTRASPSAQGGFGGFSQSASGASGQSAPAAFGASSGASFSRPSTPTVGAGFSQMGSAAGPTAAGSKTGSGELPGSAAGDGIRIGVDKDTNTLLVSATAVQWRQVEKILLELDRMPGEVLIEASILEVTLTKDNSLGVNFSAIASKNFTTTLSSSTAGTVTSAFPGLSFSYIDGNLQAAISALSVDSKIEVLSAPKIITLDNKTATLNVGDQVPVVTQSAQSTVTSTAQLVDTVDYRNTGVILKVTPRITGDDTIILEISQEVSSVQQTTSSGIDSPTIQQRDLDSTVILNDGGVVALGGMISSTKSTSNSGVPLLKDVPGLGGFFRSTDNSTGRTELIVLLTAKIIHNRTEAEQTKARMLTDMKALKGNAALHP